MSNKISFFLKGTAILIMILFSNESYGQISVDAGITPALDRWIIRAQTKFMERNDPYTDDFMKGSMLHGMIAYGLQRNLTLMMIGMHQFNEMGGTMKMKDNGFSDLSFIAKYSFYRINEREYTFGIAGVTGLNLPMGEKGFSSETWGISTGLFASYRFGKNSFDLNLSYHYNGITSSGAEIRYGDQSSFDFAYTKQIVIGGNSNITLAPLVEISYKLIQSDEKKSSESSNNGESILFVSPGIKFTFSSFVAEALLRIPVWQKQDKMLMQLSSSSILGLRYMF